MIDDRQQSFAESCIQILTLKKSGRKQIASGLVKLLFLSLAIVGISPVVIVTPAQAYGITNTGIVCKSSTSNSITVTYTNNTGGSSAQYIRGFRSNDTSTVSSSSITWVESVTSSSTVAKSTTVDLTFTGLAPGKWYYFSGDRNSNLPSLNSLTTQSSSVKSAGSYTKVCGTSAGTARSITVTNSNVPAKPHPGDTFTATAVLSAGTDTASITWSATSGVCTPASGVNGASTTFTFASNSAGIGSCIPKADIAALAPYAAGTGSGTSVSSKGVTTLTLTPAYGTTLKSGDTITVTATLNSYGSILTGNSGTVRFSGATVAPGVGTQCNTSVTLDTITGTAKCTYKAIATTGWESFTANFTPTGSTYEVSDTPTVSYYASPSTVSTTTSLETSTAVHKVGTLETLTAVVSGLTSASGTVAFSVTVGGMTTTICASAAVTYSGSRYIATCQFTPTSAGSTQVNAKYSGNASASPPIISSDAPTLSMTVSQQTTYILITATPSSMALGGSATVSVTVSSDSLTARAISAATGTLTFKLNGVQVETKTVTGTSGIQTFTWTPTQAYTSGESLTIAYSGDSNYLTSTSGWASVVVSKKSTVIDSTNSGVSDQTPTVGSGVDTVTVYITDSSTPSGVTKFYVGGVGSGVNCPIDPTSAFYECPWTPAAGGETITVIFTPSDSANYVASAPYLPTVTVAAAPTIQGASTISVTYGSGSTSSTFTTTGGTAPFTWNTPSLPSGATFDTNTAVLSVLNSTANGTSITLSGSDSNGVAANKTITISRGSATVRIQAGSATITYGATSPTITSSVTSGTFVGSDTYTATFTYSGTSDSGTVFTNSASIPTYSGTYTIKPVVTISPSGSASSYTIETATGTLIISKKSISVTPTAVTKTYGDVNPSLAGFTISGGLVGSDTITAITETTTASTLSDFGSYTIYGSSPTFGSGSASNYSISFGTGTLSVLKKSLSTTSPTIASRVYAPGNYAAGAVTLGTITGFVGSDTSSVTITPSATNYDTVTVGTRTSTVSYALSGAKGGNYSLANSTNINGVITKASPTYAPSVVWAPSGIRMSTVLGAAQLSPKASDWGMAGTVAFSPDSGTTMSAGLGQTLRAVFTPADSVNYTTDTRTALIDVSSAVKPGAPTSPVLASVGGSAGTLSLNWVAPTDDGDSAIIRYEYRVARADLLSWPSTWTQTTGTETTATISGLTNGKSYLAQVRAVNGVGESAFTQTASSASPSGEAPQLQGAPNLTSAVPDTSVGGKVTLSFTAPTIIGTPAVNAFTNYQYTTDGGLTWKSTADTSTTIVVTGLTNGSAYTFKVRVVNAAGAGTASGTQTATPRKKPDVVTTVSLSAGSSGLTVLFTPPADNGGSSLTYRYKIRKSDGSYGSDWLTISSLSDSGTAKSFSITRDASGNVIANGTTYFVKIKSTNTWFDSDDSSEVSVNATVAQSPVIDSITPDSGFTSGRSFTLSVTAHAVGSETLSYRWYKSTDTATTLSTSSSYSVSSAVTANSGNYFVTITSTLGANGTTAQVTNSDPITITINGPPTISNKSSIPGATQGQSYSFTLTAAGTGPITWPAVSSSLLPKGLTFTNSGSNAGKISGTLDATAATTTVSMTLTDGAGVTNTETFTITVSSPLAIATTTLGSATKGSYYYSALTATGGKAPYTWSVLGSDVLPSGLNLYNDTATGTSYIADTATVSATSKTFTLKLRDANGVEKTSTFTISVVAQAPGTPTLSSLDTTTAGGLVVNWTRPATNFSIITGYTINYSANSDEHESSEDKGSKTFTVTAGDTNTAFSYSLTTLSKGRTYTVTVSAFSSGASGTPSNSRSQKVGTKPSAPTAPSLTQTKSGMQVRWNKSDDDGGDRDGVNYEAECWDISGGSPFAITFSSRDSEDSKQERGEATGFTQGHSYKCHIRTKNGYGTSDWSPDSSPAKYTSVPSAPTIDTATAAGAASGKITVSWRLVPIANNGGESITSYTVSSGKNGDDKEENKKGCTVTATADRDTNGYSCQVSGLPSKGQMTVYLYAINKNGSSSADSMTVYISGKTQTLTYTPITTKRVNDADFPVVASVNSGQKVSILIGDSGTASVCEKSSKGQIHLKRAGTCIVRISQNGKASSGDENKNEKSDNGNGDHDNNCASGKRDDEHPTCDDGENHGDDTEWEAITPVTLSFQVIDIAPLAPISVAAKAGNGQLAINWAPASGNAGKPDSYTVEVRVNSDTPSDTWPSTGTAPKNVTDTNTVVTGLTNGTKYQVRVRSNNAGGNSSYTIAAGFYVPMTVPDSPTITSVDGFDETSTAIIKWTRPTNNGGSQITGYKVTGTSTGNPGTWTCSTGADSVTANYQCSISGLKNKYTYSFTVVATNAIGNSVPSNAMGTTLNGLSQTISISDTPTATGWTVGSTDPIINAKATSGLQVVYTTSTSGVCTVSNTAPSVGAVHFVGSGDCRIAMDQNGEGSKYNAAPTVNYTMSVDPATPSAPILKSVTSVATGLSVVWDPPTRTGGGTLTESVTATGGGRTFNCQPTSGAHTCILVGDPSGASTISKGITYSVTVTASNAAGTSDPSNTLTGVWLTVPTVPQSVTASTDPADGRAIKLSWNKSASNGGSTILRYEATASASGLPDKLCSVTRTDVLDSATAYTCTITGARAGSTYTVSFVAINAVGKSAAASATPLQIGKSQTITVNPIGDMRYGDPDTQTVATIDSAQPLNYEATSTPSSACSVNTTTGAVKILLVGSCTITVSQSGATDANESQYKAATPVSVTFNIAAVAPGQASIKSIATDSNTATVKWTDTTFDGGATSSPIAYASSGTLNTVTDPKCSPSPSTIQVGERTCTITGLTKGQQYSIVIRTTNTAGLSLSDSITAKTFDPNPSAPEPATASRGVRSSIVTWGVPAYVPVGSAISSYEVQVSKDGFATLDSVTASSSASTITVTNLLNDTQYEYRVRAIAKTTDETQTATSGEWSGSAFARTYALPSVPLNLTGIKGYSTAAKVSLSWSTPSSNGGTPITGYVVTANGSAITCASSTATSCEVETLTAGTSYTFTVLAQNAVGNGPVATLVLTTINKPQTAPVITATVVKDDVADTATVTWTGIAASQNGGSPVLSYKVIAIRADDASETGEVCIVKALDADDNSPYSCTFTGVKYKTNLKYKVVASNIAGDGPSSGFTNTIRLVLTQTITFPAIASQSFNAGSVNLGATASSGAIVRYTVVTPSVCSVASDTATVATFTIAGDCQVRAEQDGAGTNFSAADSVTVTFTITSVAPAAITLNQLTPGAGQIRATWSPRTFLGGASSARYLLSWSKTNDFTAEDNEIVDSDTSTVITGLQAKTLYYVRVKVLTPNWETGSAWSNVLSATTFDAPAAPVITSATQNAPGSVVIVWANVPETSTGGSPITGYTVEAFNATTGATVSKTCSAASSTCTIAGLSGGIYHRFRATAYNAVGSATSALYPAYPDAGVRPGAEQIITASNYTVPHTSAKFKLDAASSSGLPLSFAKYGSEVKYDSITAGFGVGRTVCSVDAVTGEVTVDLAGTCQIAINQDGSSDSVTASSYLPAVQKVITITVQATAPTIPTKVSVIPEPTKLNIAWSAPEDDGGVGIRYYDLFYWPASDPTNITHYGVQVTALSRQIIGLINGTKYGVSIKATNVANLQGDGS